MDTPRDDHDRVLVSGDRGSNPEASTSQPISPKHTSPDGVISSSAHNTQVDHTSVHQLQVYVPQEHNHSYPGYGTTWNTYSQYMNPDGLHVMSPVMYNENPSLLFHSGFGFNADIGYGQYSPVGTPLPPLMVDGQLYSAHQIPFSTSYFPQPNMPHISSAVPVPPTDHITPESASIDNMFFGPGSGYVVNYGSMGAGNLISSPMPSPTIYPPPTGILGSYENSFGQISQHQRSNHGFGLVSSSQYPLGGSYQNSAFGGASFPYSIPNDLNQLTLLDKGRRRDREQDSVSVSNESRDMFNDRNRGPRASKMKGKSGTEQASLSSVTKKTLSSLPKDLVSDYEDAKFFIIKSFSEDNVHKSIKYNVWASTPHGNKKLDAAYQEAKERKPDCPVLLFFSVNASGQFCGVAEMAGSVDFEKDAEHWQQDRWSGQFPVKWLVVKDVANIRFRHILLDNNDNKPVTHSRDSQEVGLKQGLEMLKIFKEHEARTCILDDFEFYDERERALRERKARQQQQEDANRDKALSTSLAKALVLGEDEEGQRSD